MKSVQRPTEMLYHDDMKHCDIKFLANHNCDQIMTHNITHLHFSAWMQLLLLVHTCALNAHHDNSDTLSVGLP